ncbi:Transcription factor [Penicillium fimorum]|uniref:Transcription factor n=1 Tax=Penicillium fimorum TaxID=1882269 RepID=A0A9W9XUK5_9EURO|nr:Transcription factor [Penicillium fimorum]
MRQPQLPCNCLARTTEALGCFPDLSTRSPTETYRIPLDEVLSLGTALVEHWVLLHGCTVTDTHLDTRMLQTMIDAALKTLTLYDAVVESILGGWGKESNGGEIGMCTLGPRSTWTHR